jgi:uncharacterized protein YegL
MNINGTANVTWIAPWEINPPNDPWTLAPWIWPLPTPQPKRRPKVIRRSQPKKKRAPIKRRENMPRTKTKKETYITLVLDKSSSMTSCYGPALSAINEQIETIKKNAKKGGKTYVSLILFDHEVEIVFENTPASQLRKLTEDDYALRGTTALRDAVRTAAEIMREHTDGRKNQGFLVVLISDGMENASGTTQVELKSLIDELESTDRWTFTYMLDGHSWEQIQDMTFSGYGGNLGNYATFTSDNAGMRSAGIVAVNSVGSYMDSRKEGTTSKTDFYNDGSGEEKKA